MFVKMNESFALGDDDILRYQDRLCVRDVDDFQTKIIAETHGSKYSIHLGSTKMYLYIKQIYLWDGMKKDIEDYVAKCPHCHLVKVEHLKPGGLTQIIELSTFKWEAINMDFVVYLLKTKRQYDSIWVIVDWMTKSVHFIRVKPTYRAEDYAELYIDEIVRWHGKPLSIISDRGAQFTSQFLRSFQKSLGMQFKFSTTFYPHTNGQAEHTISTFEDMRRACVIDFNGSWEDHIPLIEFS